MRLSFRGFGRASSFCNNLHILLLIIELDAKAVVDVFLNPSYQNNVISAILNDCKELLLRFQQVQFRHCFCQANRCADVLARLSTDQDVEFISVRLNLFNHLIGFIPC